MMKKKAGLQEHLKRSDAIIKKKSKIFLNQIY